MNFEEHAAKPLLQAAGIPVPRSRLAATPEEAERAAMEIGAVVVKAQVPTGKRGKAGGIRLADTPRQARDAALAILGMSIGEFPVARVLVEAQADIARELYAAVLNDPDSRSPRVMLSAAGGMDIEEIARSHPDQLRQHVVDIRAGFAAADARSMLEGLELDGKEEAVGSVLERLYTVYIENDAELVEINPLALLASGELMALDCKFVLDDSGAARRPALRALGAPEPATELERRGRELDLKYIELDGDIGVLANGAGLTMTTMDVIAHLGGAPANFLEIGGEAYTKAMPALELVLGNPRVKCLVVNFCGAFARTDVMTAGVLDAYEALRPEIPFFFSVHGTGAAEAVAMLGDRLGITPYPTMDEAIRAAIAAAADAGERPS